MESRCLVLEQQQMVNGQVALLAHHDMFSSMVIVGLEASLVDIESYNFDSISGNYAGQPADYLLLIPVPGIEVFGGLLTMISKMRIT